MKQFYGFEWSSANSASPELSGAQSCFKSTLTIANIIFLIFGSILCGVGGYAMQTKAGGLAGETLPSGIIVMGVFIILMSFLGCVAAHKESRLFLAVYFGFLLIFVIILFAVGIAVYALKDQAEKFMVEGWCEADNSQDGILIDIQNYFQCCGLYQYNDSMSRVQDGHVIDAACSHVKIPFTPRANSLPCPAGLNSGNGLPCLPILESSFESSYIAAGACAIAFAVIMSAGMILVCILMAGIKQKQHLEDIRKLHRKLREAKEDPAHTGLRGLQAGGAIGMTGSEFNEVDLNPAEPLDADVQINMSGVGGNADEQDAISGYTPGESTFKAQPPVKMKKNKKNRQLEPEPEPEVEEVPYEGHAYEEEQTMGGYAPQADEYDEED